MPTIEFRSPVRVPLLPFGARKPMPPDPRAYDTFRVTQRFDDPDFINPQVQHNAVDIGNFRCGDTVVSMAAGTATRVKDNAKAARGAPSDALGIRVDHGGGIISEYWHLSQWLTVSGTRVNAGQPIGSVGDTGLGSVCHLHIEVKINGRRVDPLPYMMGAVNVAFRDVPAGSTHANDIKRAAELGLMVGVSADRFDPKGLTTREQSATIAVRLYDLLRKELGR